jgi:hypothetical protein
MPFSTAQGACCCCCCCCSCSEPTAAPAAAGQEAAGMLPVAQLSGPTPVLLVRPGTADGSGLRPLEGALGGGSPGGGVDSCTWPPARCRGFMAGTCWSCCCGCCCWFCRWLLGGLALGSPRRCAGGSMRRTEDSIDVVLGTGAAGAARAACATGLLLVPLPCG